MNRKNHTIQQAREFLKQEALKEIYNNSDFTKFQRRVFCVIAKYGLQFEAKKEELLVGDEWSDLNYKEALKSKIEQFFDRHFK